MGKLSSKSPRIVIIGAGVGGIASGLALKRKLGYDNFLIYEKASDVGGTWRNNMYPGCSSDVAMQFYCLSTDLNPEWNFSHGYQPEIQQYWRELCVKYDIYAHTVFETLVVGAKWDDTLQLYHVNIKNLQSGKQDIVDAEIVISALGVLEVTRYPDIQGLDTFKGEIFHSGAWDNKVDLKGKRVGVIGNGASATQFVPIISEDPSIQITEFCRTPNWFLPPIRTPNGPVRKWILRNIPFCMKLSRFQGFLTGEFLYWSVFGTRFLHPVIKKFGAKYIKDNAPKEYQDKLIPTYTPGCKRIIFDTDFLAALHRPNLTLNWDGIEEILESGIRTKTGETIPLDILIFATGYIADDYPLPIQGRDRSMREYIEACSGPQAYLGTTVPGFPNLFLIGGPNVTTGHTSVLYSEEIQIQYALKLIRPILDHVVDSFEVKDEPTDGYNVKIQKRLKHSVFFSCHSWYRRGSDGKVASIFPGAGALFQWWLRNVKWDDYKVVPAEPWKHLRRKRKIVTTIKTLVFCVALAFAGTWGLTRPSGYFDDWRGVVKQLGSEVLTGLRKFIHA